MKFFWFAMSASVCSITFLALAYHSQFIDLGFDPAYHASVSKNIASGIGYTTSYDKLFYLNPDITTGPLMILFAASLMAIFGNLIWLPAFSAFLLNTVIFAGIVCLSIKRGLTAKNTCYFISSSLLILICHHFNWLFAFKGDFTAVLLVLLSFLLLYGRRQPSKIMVFSSVIAFILALATKKIVLLALIGFIPYVYYCAFDNTRSSLKIGFQALLLACLLILMWFILESYLLTHMSSEEILERSAYQKWFLLNQGSGLANLMSGKPISEIVLNNFEHHTHDLLSFYRQRFSFSSIQLFILLLIISFALFIHKKQKSSLHNSLYIAITLVCVVFFMWFLFLSAAWNAKYALSFIILFMLVLNLWFCEQGKGGFILMAWMCLFFSGSNFQFSSIAQAASFTGADSEYRKELIDLKALIMSGQLHDYPLAGCGWVFAPHELEYILPNALNFKDCRQLILNSLSFNGEEYLRKYPAVQQQLDLGLFNSAQDHYHKIGIMLDNSFSYSWRSEANFYLVLNNLYWNSSVYSPRYQNIAKACFKVPIYEGDYLSLALCQHDNLKRGIYLDQREFFLKHEKGFNFVHKPDQLKR